MKDFSGLEYIDYEGDTLTVTQNSIGCGDLCFSVCMDEHVTACVMTPEQALELAARIVEIYA